MNPPVEAARELLGACLVGCAGGVWYGFLRPVRPRWLSDLFFLFGLLHLWLILGFGICDGDLRLGYTAALLLSIFLFDRTAGKLLRPLFYGFWKHLRQIIRFLVYPLGVILKKTGKIAKKIFAKGKKWGTIKWKEYLSRRGRKGGADHGTGSEQTR